MIDKSGIANVFNSNKEGCGGMRRMRRNAKNDEEEPDAKRNYG